MILLWVILGLLVLFGASAFFGAPYVPSHRREVRDAFKKLYALDKHDVVVDLGSGDGVVMSEALRRGAQVYGVELNPLLVAVTRFRLRKNHRATVQMGDMWRFPLPADTTLVYAFSVTRDGAKLARHLQREANRINRTIHVMMYGPPLRGPVPKQSRRGHTLYEIAPLQGQEA